MLIGEIIRVALSAIRSNKLRSFLTSLGIIIGVGAVITMVAVGTGAQKAVEERIEGMGANVLSVYAGQSFHRGVASANRVSLTTDDAEALTADARYIDQIVPELQRSFQIQFLNQNINVNVIGTTPNFLAVKNFDIEAGRMFTTGDDEARRRYAVVGYAVPEMLGQNGAAMIGQTIRIRGIPFEIIGLLAEKGSSGSWNNPDEQILVPLATAQHRIMGTDRLRSISVQAEEGGQDLAMLEIERVMRREHKIRPGDDNDFQIRNRADIATALSDTTSTFTFLLAGIAAVSLLVGGIGIMNIMLVSVTERTREIGTRKAMGATRFNIMFQFLVEAVVLCMFGGLIGIIGGTMGAIALAKLANWNTLVSWPAVGLAFFFSAAVGIFFGIWPARRASGLDPIDALRYE